MGLKNSEIIRKFNKHKSLFEIRDSKILTLFNALIPRREDPDHLECSVKFYNGEIYPCRFNLTLGAYNKDNVQRVLSFLSKLNEKEHVRIKISRLKRRFQKFIPLSRTFITGIDLRDSQDSRLKYWFQNKNFLFGWDVLFYKNLERKRTYLFVDTSDKTFLKLKEELGSIFSKLANTCSEIRLKREEPSQLHFRVIDREAFLSFINSQSIKKFFDRYPYLRTNFKYMGLLYKELKDRNVKNFNVYY